MWNLQGVDIPVLARRLNELSLTLWPALESNRLATAICILVANGTLISDL